MSLWMSSGRGMRRKRRRVGTRQICVLVALLLSTATLGLSTSGVLEDSDPAKVRHWQEPPAGTGRRKAKAAVSPPPALRQRPPTTLEHLVAGTVGGISGALVSYPLDTVRVRMQTGGKHFGAARTASLLLQEAGVAGFYRGVLSPVAGAGLIKAAVFGGYGLFQSIVRKVSGKDGEELTLMHLGVAAMGSGLVGSFVVTPVERIKVVMQAAIASAPSPSRLPNAAAAAAAVTTAVAGGVTGGGATYSNAWGCARGLVAENGLRRGLYAGLGPTLLREVPGYACYFATYEACKRVLLRESSDLDEASRGTVMFKTALSGALAGIAAWLPVYPADVVKSRMQNAGAGGGGMLATASSMWRTEGFTPFYRGLAPTLARAAVNHAATFLVYEATMEWMRRGERHNLMARELDGGGRREGEEEVGRGGR